MRALFASLLVIGCATLVRAQPVATFNDFSPTVKGMTVGTSHCYLWTHLGAPWDTEVACYTGATIGQIQAQPPGRGMQGSYPIGDGGIITWLITPNGALSYFQLTAQASGGVEIYREGSI